MSCPHRQDLGATARCRLAPSLTFPVLVLGNRCSRCEDEWTDGPPTESEPTPTVTRLRQLASGRLPSYPVCTHLGPLIAKKACEGCGGRTRLKVYRCEHPDHDEVTILDCRGCVDYAAAEG